MQESRKNEAGIYQEKPAVANLGIMTNSCKEGESRWM